MALRWSSNMDMYTRPKLMDADLFEPNLRAYPYEDCGDHPYIRVNERAVTFVGQRGPIQEHGVNGCKIDDMLTFALGVLVTFNKKFPCRENSLAITKLEECLHWLDARKRDHTARGVEGTDNK
jgi:hypothetical protein